MDANKYQELTKTTVKQSLLELTDDIPYYSLGLSGEAGEVANNIKKSIRDHKGDYNINKAKIKDELGDCLWYISRLGASLNLDLADIMQSNLNKLINRYGNK